MSDMIVLDNLKDYIFSTRSGDDIGNAQIVFKFPNGYGASVVRGKYTYGGDQGLFELAVIKFTTEKSWGIVYDTPITNDVIGYLEVEEVFELLETIKALPEKEVQ